MYSFINQKTHDTNSKQRIQNGVQNQLPISFGTSVVCNMISKVRNSPHTHTNFKP